MALNNILAPRQAVINSQGAPLAGGFVYLYEPGTTTFITSYTSSDLIQPHSNPIRLSGSGRANIWITRNCDMLITDRLGNNVLTEDDANPDALGGDSSGGLVPNGSFEVVTTPPVPDSWVAVDEAGSTNAADSSQSTDGANSYRFTSSGVGGGSLTTTDFFPVNDVDQLRVNFDLFSTLATVLNIVRVEWYDVTFVSISNSDVYSSTANPLAWTEFQLVATPPALARFAKLRLIGIDPSVPLAGSTYFDRISVFYPTVVSGIFDNITIQDNEIISTNLNGVIELKPNGTGQVLVGAGVGANAEPMVIIGNANANPATPDLLDARILFQSADFNDYAEIGMAGEDVVVRGFADGGTVSLEMTHTVAGLVAGVELADSGVSLRALEDNATVLTVPSPYDGVYIQGLLSNDPDTGGNQDQQIGFYNSGIQWTGRVGFDSGPNLLVSNFVVGGTVELAVAQAIGTFRSAFVADPTATTDIYHTATDDLIAQSDTPANGGLFVDNQLTGAGLERVLTASDLSSLGGVSVYKAVATDRVSTTTPTADPDLTLTFPVSGVYLVRLELLVRDISGSSNGIRIEFGGTALSNSYWSWWAKLFTGASLAPRTTVSPYSSQDILPNTSGAGTTVLTIEACVRINAAGTFTMEWAQENSNVTAVRVDAGSVMNARLLAAS